MVPLMCIVSDSIARCELLNRHGASVASLLKQSDKTLQSSSGRHELPYEMCTCKRNAAGSERTRSHGKLELLISCELFQKKASISDNIFAAYANINPYSGCHVCKMHYCVATCLCLLDF